MSGDNIPETAKAKHYKELLVWQRSMSLAKAVYQLTMRFPVDERFGLTALVRRTAVSIPSSIAKGQARYETRDFLQHLSYADGYLAELETQLLLSLELGFCVASDVENSLREIDELQRMLNAISRKLISGSPLATRHSSLSSGEAKDSF
ncbi:MAG TPA: four helix bundle protein [Candidatus Acidoferrum sp.]|nr:four helix bundle protein [Candidatus Acidoferrum sp.]